MNRRDLIVRQTIDPEKIYKPGKSLNYILDGNVVTCFANGWS
jgi:hypothetical protein